MYNHYVKDVLYADFARLQGCRRYDSRDAYMEVGGRATQEAKAEGIGTTPWMGEVELCLEQQSRVESGTETESDTGRI